MKTNYLLSLLILVSKITFGQVDSQSEIILGVVKRDIENVQILATSLKDEFNVCYSKSTTNLSANDIVKIAGITVCINDNKFFYKAVFNGENLLIDSSAISSDVDIVRKFGAMDTTQYLNYLEKVLRLDHYMMLSDTLKAKKELLEKGKSGLVILNYKVYDQSEYTDGTGFRVEVLNTSQKTIKYITFSYVGYNAVDDPVSQYGKSLVTLRGIGPIKQGETASYDKDYAWLTDIVQRGDIKSISIQYTDGTSKLFKSIKTITLSNMSKKYLNIE